MSRPSEKCSTVLHEAMKRDDGEWSRLEHVGFQEDYDENDNRADLELKNCACGSTLARRVPGAKAGDVDEEPEPVGGVMQPPVKIRRNRRRSRPRSASFGNANRGKGQTWRRLDAKLGIRAGAPIEFNLDEIRPKTRGECIAGIRPCVFVGCRHHLYLDINPDTGSIKLNFPELELEQLAETCVLDVADRGGITLEKTGEFLNLTRERARQIELKAYAASQAAPLIAELRSA